MSTQVRTDRLRKLADHLMNKMPAGHVFSFGTLYEEKRDFDSGYCGTVACGLGELPFCYPDYWIIDIKAGSPHPLPYLKELSNESTFDDAGDFFNLDGPQVQHLFMPHSQNKVNAYPGLAVRG